MSLITKALAGLLLVSGLFGTFLYHRNQSLRQSLKAEQARVLKLEHTLIATEKSLATYVARAKATAERRDKNQKEVTHALESHPDWRDLPVPDAVYDSLYGNRTAVTPGKPAR